MRGWHCRSSLPLRHPLVAYPASAAAQDKLMFRYAAIVAFLLVALARPASADVTGPATVIHSERVRLQGINALSCGWK